MFNVGGDRPYTVAEFASAVAEVFGVKGYKPIPCGKYRFGDTRHICSDVSKLKRLGWQPTRSIFDSVEAYKGWLATADNAANILDYCNQQMVKLNVVREVSKA
jgi:dTDP-L-rhamnose 4-epimerase